MKTVVHMALRYAGALFLGAEDGEQEINPTWQVEEKQNLSDYYGTVESVEQTFIVQVAEGEPQSLVGMLRDHIKFMVRKVLGNRVVSAPLVVQDNQCSDKTDDQEPQHRPYDLAS